MQYDIEREKEKNTHIEANVVVFVIVVVGKNGSLCTDECFVEWNFVWFLYSYFSRNWRGLRGTNWLLILKIEYQFNWVWIWNALWNSMSYFGAWRHLKSMPRRSSKKKRWAKLDWGTNKPNELKDRLNWSSTKSAATNIVNNRHARPCPKKSHYSKPIGFYWKFHWCEITQSIQNL